MAASPARLSGRRAEAARNDERILAAARTVFLADPKAPIAAVARAAGVGISALYARYPSKDELLRRLCHDGLELFVAETERALSRDGDAWEAFVEWMSRLVAADTSSLTLALAGTFAPTEDMFALADRASELSSRMFRRVKPLLRAGVGVHDLSLVFEQIAALRFADQARTEALRQRHLTIILDGLRARERGRLPGRAPRWEEINERWIPAGAD